MSTAGQRDAADQQKDHGQHALILPFGPRLINRHDPVLILANHTKVRPYVAEHPITYPVVIGNLDLLQHTFGLEPSLPVTLLIDRDGKVAESHVGMVDKTAFERDIRRLLHEKAK